MEKKGVEKSEEKDLLEELKLVTDLQAFLFNLNDYLSTHYDELKKMFYYIDHYGIE